ncbi:hypothetical protein AB0902_26960, partial [Streptomyces syringium]
MRILVLGATGFLGRHAVGQLRALPGARVSGGGRAPGADLPVDLATADPAHLAGGRRAAAPPPPAHHAGARAERQRGRGGKKVR